MDRQWAEAVEIGKKNQHTLMLVQNWCANARIENHGGVGLIQVETGLPIGHLAMACDYASSNGTMASWDLVDSALVFHDRNCANCVHRKPVCLPNLSKLVMERDAVARTQEAKAAAQELERADSLRKRRAARKALRASLPPPSQTLIDLLDTLDTGSDTKAGEKLAETAELAPEAFTPDLIEFLFGLIERNERWAMETALVVLDKVGAAPDRLANGALRSLWLHGGVKSAEVLLRHLKYARKDMIPRAVPMLIHHAEPADLPFIEREENADPRFLATVHKAFPTEVEGVVDELLGSKDLERMSDGARAVCVLGTTDCVLALRFSRTVISKLVRTKWDDGHDYQLSALRGELRRAAALAFRLNPTATETLIESFRMGATSEGHKELLSIYRCVLSRRWNEEDATFDAGDTAAFDRMIALASNPLSDEVVSELGSFFAHSSHRFKDLAVEKVDALLGAAALLANALDRLDAQHKATRAPDFLSVLERNNRRRGLTSLQSSLVKLAAKAAANGPERIRKFLSLLENIPSDHTELRHTLICNLHELITSPETLAEVLPHLYSALVGASTLERGAAARTIGEIQDKLLEDAPPLLLEAFVSLLWDQYLFPIEEVVEALRQVHLPDDLNAAVRARLWVIICSYATTSDKQHFLLQAINTFTAQFASDDQLAGEIGETLVEFLERHDVSDYYRELRHLAYRFKQQPTFGRLVMKALLDPDYRDLGDTVEVLGDLPVTTVVANSIELEALIEVLSLEYEEWWISQILIEVFTRSGLWNEALRAIDAMLGRIEDLPRNRRRRLHLKTVRAAVEVEHAVAQGKLGDIAVLATTWRAASTLDQEDANLAD